MSDENKAPSQNPSTGEAAEPSNDDWKKRVAEQTLESLRWYGGNTELMLKEHPEMRRVNTGPVVMNAGDKAPSQNPSTGEAVAPSRPEWVNRVSKQGMGGVSSSNFDLGELLTKAESQ